MISRGGLPRYGSPTLSTRRTTLSRLLLALLLVAAMVASAHGSHYRLGESGLVTADELATLKKAGIATTKDVVEQLGPKVSRKAHAKTTRMSPKRLLSLAQTCDLLRIPGLGMIMAKLLTAAGVPDTRALKAKRADALATAVNKANAAKRITEVTPNATQLSQWIAQAKALKQVLERR